MPVANRLGVLPLTDQQQREWSLLDTFDWLSPEFDNPQTPATVRSGFDAVGMTQVGVGAESRSSYRNRCSARCA
jgi:hypothetical protein